MKKPTIELKKTCIHAIENQMKALVEAEGEGNCRNLLYNLKKELGEVQYLLYDDLYEV